MHAGSAQPIMSVNVCHLRYVLVQVNAAGMLVALVHFAHKHGVGPAKATGVPTAGAGVTLLGADVAPSAAPADVSTAQMSLYIGQVILLILSGCLAVP